MAYKMLLTIVILSTINLSIFAQELYFRFKDKNGRIAITQILKPDHLSGGYDIINKYGNVIRTVPPYHRKSQEAQTSTIDDQVLLRVYRNVKDIQDAMERTNHNSHQKLENTKKEIVQSHERLDALYTKLDVETFHQRDASAIQTQIRNLDLSITRLTLHASYVKDTIAKDTTLYEDRIRQYQYLKKNMVKPEISQ